jgi:hypothetical protein
MIHKKENLTKQIPKNDQEKEVPRFERREISKRGACILSM